MSRLSAKALDLSTLPKVVCVLDLETSGPHAIKPDRADLAVVGLKVYTWDEQQKCYLAGSYEHYAPTDFSALQQRLDELPGPIVGHNLFNFDYRVLRRHLNLGQILEKSADTLHLLYEMGGGGEEGFLHSLDMLAKENLGEGKKAKASTIPKLLKEGKLAEVLTYNERDCDLTFRLWWKMVSERHISTDKVSYEDEFPEEIAYNLEDEEVSVITCATPRFTYTTWSEQLERDGWIVMPPEERRRREKEHEQQWKEAREAADKRSSTMREFIKQHLRDDIPRKFTQSDSDDPSASLNVEEAQAFLTRADLPKTPWAAEVVYRLLRGKHIHPARLELAGRPDDSESLTKLMKDILGALADDGYEPRYSAYGEPGSDSVSLAGPPPRPRTLAEQHVDQLRERYFEMEALFGPESIECQSIPRNMAYNVHFAYTDAMNILRGHGHFVFQDESYVLDTQRTDLFQLQPQVLTSEERRDLEAYLQDPPAEFSVPLTVPQHVEAGGHDLALHRRNAELSQGVLFHVSCSCGWQSEPDALEIDARASGTLHVVKARRQKDERAVLRFKEHTLTVVRVNDAMPFRPDDERWVGVCACSWSCRERTEDDMDAAYEKHWTALLDDPTLRAEYFAFLLEDPTLRAEYLAFLQEQGLPLPEETSCTASTSENGSNH